jgi:hypothetical protein
MSTPSELPHELQEVEASLQAALQEGGIEACQRFIDRLAVEAEMGHIITNEIDLAILQGEELADVFPEIREAAEAQSKELADLGFAGQMAVLRHTYAVAWLHRAQNQD